MDYGVDHLQYWFATDRNNLKAEQLACVHKLRWTVESYFARLKWHLKLYHILSHNCYGLMLQILVGLITYLLFAMHCRQEHEETVSNRRVLELQFRIKKEAASIKKQQNHKEIREAIDSVII